jgi:hypothetical protein
MKPRQTMVRWSWWHRVSRWSPTRLATVLLCAALTFVWLMSPSQWLWEPWSAEGLIVERSAMLWPMATEISADADAAATRSATPPAASWETGWRVSPHSAQDSSAWKHPWREEVSPEPALWGEQLFVTLQATDSGRLTLASVDRHTGQWRWQKELLRSDEVPAAVSQRHVVASPVCDAEYVYVPAETRQGVTLFAFKHQGSLAWQQPLGPYRVEPGSRMQCWLAGPIVLVAGQTPVTWWTGSTATGFLTAVQRHSGDRLWRRRITCPADSCVGLIAARANSRQLILAERHQLASYDVVTGERLWWSFVDGQPQGRLSLAGHQQRLFSLQRSAQHGELVCWPTDHVGELTSEDCLWRVRTPTPASVVWAADRLVTLTTDGRLTVWDPASGRAVVEQPFPGVFAHHPLVMGQRLICPNTSGALHAFDLLELHALPSVTLPPSESTVRYWLFADGVLQHNQSSAQWWPRTDSVSVAEQPGTPVRLTR